MTNQTRPRLGETLVERGLLTPAMLAAALSEHRVTHERLGQILVRRGFVAQKTLLDVLKSLQVEDFGIAEYFSSKIPDQVLLDLQVMVVAETEGMVYLGSASPERLVVARVSPFLDPAQQIKFVPYRAEQLRAYLTKLAARSGSGLLERLLSDAVRLAYSDLHIVPKDNSYAILARHLGVRKIIHEGSIDEYAHLAARIKDRAKMDIAERRLPQDGAFGLTLNGRGVDIRVATVPTLVGEYLVLRVLDPDNAQKSLEQLGITNLTAWRAGVRRPDGLCLICGPTGSGKTTTLQATLRELDRFGSAIFTAEDPVEYRLPFVGQVNVNPEIGLTFDRSLKAFMRADPDIIILGEIRDIETAKSAIKMAETGHLVIATLHTESIFGAIQRLQDIGVPSHELKHLLRAVLVQRLIRVICPHCQGVGCPHCQQGGYADRTVVSECAYFPHVADVQALLDGVQSWPSMLADAHQKMLQGVTDRREFIRVFQTEAERLLQENNL